jgi:hypothetical protein
MEKLGNYGIKTRSISAAGVNLYYKTNTAYPWMQRLPLGAEQEGSNSNGSDLYSVDTELESRPGH